MSRQAAGKGRALLEKLGLTPENIAEVYGQINNDEIEKAVHAGLLQWRAGGAKKDPTWAVLLKAMDDAEIAEDHIEGLKKELTKYAARKQ